MTTAPRSPFAGFSMRAVSIAVVTVILTAAVAIGGWLSLRKTGFEYSQHQKVSVNAILRLHFPEDMNEPSVEQNLTLPSDLSVEKKWTDGVLELTPTAKLSPGRSYTIRLDGKALKQNGETLGKEVIFTFDVTGAPVVTAQIPPGGATDVPISAKIVIVFDRPVVPLSQVQDSMAMRAVQWPVTISPEIAGRWRWLGTTAAQFVPEKPLPLGTAFTVTVPAGIKTVSEDITDKDFSWSFETLRPRVLSTEPEEGNGDAGPTSRVAIHFNQEMDLASAKDFLKLYEETQTSRSPSAPVHRTGTGMNAVPQGNVREVSIKTVTYGTKEVDDKKVTDKMTLVITPAEPLKYETSYTTMVLAGIWGMDGPLGSAENFSLHFRTVGALSVRAAYDYGRLDVMFSNPMNDKSFSGAILLAPGNVSFNQYHFSDHAMGDSWDTKGFTMYLSLDPSTTYTLIVTTKVTDDYGQRLDKPYQYSFTTPPYRPQLFLHPEGKTFSIFERGKTPVYFLNAVNVSGLDITMGQMPFDEFLRYRLTRYSAYNTIIDMQRDTRNVRSWHVDPKKKLNLWESIPFDLDKKGASKLAPGIYAFEMTAPETDDSGRQLRDQRVFAITNMAITLKYSGGRALVWVTDLQTGSPVADAGIEFMALDGKTQVSGKTGRDGFFETPMDISAFDKGGNSWQPEFWVVARKGDDLAFVGSDWNQGTQPYDFSGVSQDFRSPQSVKQRLLSTLYTERPLYRVGDTVFMKGMIRFLDWNGKMTIPSGKSVQMTVTDPNGKVIGDKALKIGEFGSIDDSLPIATDAPLGYYTITGKIVPGEETGSDQGLWASFQVQAYRKPEYKVTVTPERTDYFSKETVKADISGQYYFGAPMDASSVEWRAVTNDYYFNRFTDDWYSFALEDSWCWYDCNRATDILTQGKGTLDASGHLQIRFPVDLATKAVSQVVSLEADITDKNNQVVSSRADLIVHKSKVYVGIRTDDYIVASGEKAKVSIVTVNPDGTPKSSQSVDLALSSREWKTIKQKGVDGDYYYDNQPVDTFIRMVSARTDEYGKASVPVQLDAGGQFSVVVSVKDEDGRESKAGTSLYAWSSTYFNWPHSNNDRLDIILDKPSYKVGDTAKLLVKSPYQGKGVKALVTVERENVITHKVIDVTSSALPIEVPVTDDLLPIAYVSVVIVKPRMGETFNENGLDTGAPAFKVGYVKLPIDTSPRKLTVKIRTDKEKYLPGDTVTATLEAVDAKGNPVQAELSLGVVDLSLLDLTGFQMPDLVETFYAERGLGVVTSNMLAYLMERFKPGSKGGGGGAEDRPRGDFRDTAFWKARILTDINGQATVTFKLPDNLTTWQLLVLGSTRANLFGGQSKDIIETKHVILRPVRPRFAVAGDTVILGAIVHNYLDESKTFTVTLDGKGFIPTGSAQQTVTIASGGNTKVGFPVKILDAAAVSMHFLAAADSARDEITESIPVFRFGTDQANATAGITDSSETEQVAVPTKKDAPTGSLSLTVAPSIAVYLAPGLKFLEQYPYGCAEQTVSGFLGEVVLKKLQGFDAFRLVDEGTLEKNVVSGLQKLYGFQRGDGGFGYWPESWRSYPGLTAYVFYALTLTRDAGYAVDSGVIDRARAYLNTSLHATPDAETPELRDPAVRATILFVLSEDGTTDVALLNNLLKQKADMPVYARAYLAMAFQKAGTVQARKNARLLVGDVLSHAQVSARGAEFQEEETASGGFSMNTNDRTTAIALQALIRIDPTHPLLAKLVRGILAARRDGHWDTTQSTIASILSFIEYLKSTNELDYDFMASIVVDTKTVLAKSYAAGTKLESAYKDIPFSDLPRGKTVNIDLGKQGKGKLYYDLLLKYFYTPDRIEPTEEGLGIQREVEPLIKGQRGMTVGNTYKVTLTITVPETRHFVAVESPLPSGMEAIDLQLQTSPQNLSDQVNQSPKNTWWDWPLRYFSHIEFRDDRVFLFAVELPPGVYTYQYLERATLAGTFHERPAKVFEMYFPETFGQTKGDWMTISE